MNQVISNESALKNDKSNNLFKTKLNSFVLQPILSALVGFLLFLSVIFLVKFLSYSLGFQKSLSLELYDLYLSTLGFVLSFAIRFIDNFKRPN